jgi:ATP-dependent Clp protease adaptor protein ClpS
MDTQANIIILRIPLLSILLEKIMLVLSSSLPRLTTLSFMQQKPSLNAQSDDRFEVLALDLPICAANEGGDGDNSVESGVATKVKPKIKKPSLYKVLLLNDDYTPMEFVVHVLQRFFRMSVEQATQVMLHVHQKGVGVCGVFTYEVAETKVSQVMDFSKKHQHPLQCTLEKE